MLFTVSHLSRSYDIHFDLFDNCLELRIHDREETLVCPVWKIGTVFCFGRGKIREMRISYLIVDYIRGV